MKTTNNKIYNLTVKEAFKLLQSNKMANYKTNIQLTKPINHGGGNHNGRKTGSKNKLTLKSLDSKVNKLESKINNMSNDIKGVKMTLAKLASVVEQLAKEVHEGFARQEQFNKAILIRIDNLVVKNNLKE